MSGERSTMRDRAIEAHLPLVHRLARGFARRGGVEMDDLVQVGSIGLINAVDRFERARGVCLATYAMPCIVGEMQRHLRDRAHLVRVPRRVQQDRARLKRVEAQVSEADGRHPRCQEPAGAAGPDHDRTAAVVVGDPIQELIAQLADARWHVATDESEAATNRVAVAAALRGLGERERRVVKLRYFDDLSQDEIASEFGISQVQVSRLLRSCLDRLRSELDDRVVVGAPARP